MSKKQVERLEKIMQRRLAGYTYQKIAEEFGITRQRVQKIIAPSQKIRRSVIEKASSKCQACGILVHDGHVHHKSCSLIEDYNDTDNLQLLCVSCHMKVHEHAQNISEETRLKMRNSYFSSRRKRYLETGQL